MNIRDYLRKSRTSQPSGTGSTPRPPSINRFGRTGLDDPAFHTGSTAKAVKGSADHARRKMREAALRRVTACPRCAHSRLVSIRNERLCPSCNFTFSVADDRDERE